MSVIITNPYDSIVESMKKIVSVFWKECDAVRGVILKPNIVFPVAPKSGEITQPEVVRAVIRVLRENTPGIDIVIGEGTAAGTIAADNFRISGYAGLARELDVDLIDFDKAERVEIPWKYGVLDLPKLVLERYYINLPILKSSSAAHLSGAMKNQKGLLTPEMKKRFHLLGLHEPIAELARIIRPDLTIMDGRNFIRGNVFIAGDNLLAIDRLAAKLLETEEPEYLAISKMLEGESTHDVVYSSSSIRLKTKPGEQGKFKQRLNLRLWSNPRACSMCRLSFRHLELNFPGDIGSAFKIYRKLLIYAIKGTDIVFGALPEYEDCGRTVICFGNCTRKLAKEKGYRHIPGCPPTRKDLEENL
jgi:uncharacterized protein (DUF362 family)